jgi:N-acetylglucosaminyldiphosphoundecaprenol N-acetyl-beta-D-mannosaminyltransferase
MDRLNVLGVGISPMNLSRAVETIDGWIGDGRREYVCVCGVHGIMESRREPALRRLHNESGLVVPDGMPLVWLLHHAGYRDADRVYGPDLMLAMFEHGIARGIRHFLYGATPTALARLKENMTFRFPGLCIAGTLSPPFRPLSSEEDDTMVETINAAAPDIVWIGLSTPTQELWMAHHRPRLAATALIGVGAAFDFHAGLVRQAPRFVQRSGFEWLFRLSQEPRRLWQRYLRNNPRFVLEIAAQLMGLRAYSMDP